MVVAKNHEDMGVSFVVLHSKGIALASFSLDQAFKDLDSPHSFRPVIGQNGTSSISPISPKAEGPIPAVENESANDNFAHPAIKKLADLDSDTSIIGNDLGDIQAFSEEEVCSHQSAEKEAMTTSNTLDYEKFICERMEDFHKRLIFLEDEMRAMTKKKKFDDLVKMEEYGIAISAIIELKDDEILLSACDEIVLSQRLETSPEKFSTGVLLLLLNDLSKNIAEGERISDRAVYICDIIHALKCKEHHHQLSPNLSAFFKNLRRDILQSFLTSEHPDAGESINEVISICHR